MLFRWSRFELLLFLRTLGLSCLLSVFIIVYGLFLSVRYLLLNVDSSADQSENLIDFTYEDILLDLALTVEIKTDENTNDLELLHGRNGSLNIGSESFKR